VVLTAAHCAENTETGEVETPSGYEVITGNVEWTASPRQVSGVSRVVVYPGFNGTYRSGDAALLILTARTTAPAIALASYPSDSARLQAGARALIAGWGSTYPGQGSPPRLSWAGTVVQSPGYCELNTARFDKAKELCSLDPPSDETGICSGDSGGPLVTLDPARSSDIELGIASHVQGECSTGRPSVFTRADLVAPWVRSWIDLLNPPVRPGYYRIRPSKLRQIAVHVSGDGKHVVGLKIRMPVTCKRGYRLPLALSYLSYADDLPIRNGIARDTLMIGRGRRASVGKVNIFLAFNAFGGLEGHLRVHVLPRSRRVGMCAEMLKFTAKA
jgi:secreted trypsin-like serine protease